MSNNVWVSGTESSLVKRVMERLVLLIQGRVESGEIRIEKWRGKCFRSKHVKMLQWSDAKDVIGQSFLQWCCGLSRAMRASSRAARVRKAARLSEAARRVVRSWRNWMRMCVSVRRDITRGYIT